ncbi:MAG: response regulator [Polyangiaceae bacterium]
MAPRSKNSAAPLVLVAEDEPAMLNLVTNHLRGRGYNVIEASDGDEALELAQKHHPALVVLDVMMPGMSGWEVCKRVKANKESAGRTGVIMLTGIGESLNDMTSPLFAADAWLDKPFSLDQLDSKIDGVRAKLGLPDQTVIAAANEVAAAAKKLVAAAKSGAAKKAAAKKPAAPAKKAAAKKPAAKVAKKAVAKVAKKPAAKVAKKAVAKKVAPKKPAAKKPAAKA